MRFQRAGKTHGGDEQMSRHAVLVPMIAILATTAGRAQTPADLAAERRAGKNYISTPVFSADEDGKLLALYDGLRVADVTDGMDAVGLQNVGLMDPDVHPA